MKALLASLVLGMLFAISIPAQQCEPPAIVVGATSLNMFSPEQEMMLGDLLIEGSASEYREIQDPDLLEYVNRIGAKLISHLPSTGLKFHFHIVDLNDTNAFNLPGGHVFISRKIIAFAKNEDELAGLMAHELGHAAVHHGAIGMTERLRKVLKVQQVGDRKDITDKYNRLIENYNLKPVKESQDHSDNEQTEADRIGVFALVAAGYDPEGLLGVLERLAETKGKKGGWLSELFGLGNSDQKRLREFSRTTAALPAACRDVRPAQASETFLKWQADVVTYRAKDRNEDIKGLIWKKELAKKLQNDITRIDVSADGKLILARNSNSMAVIDRSTRSVLLQIPAYGANSAYLTADNKNVVFVTDGLRFERWDIEQKKAIEVRELYIKGDCFEHRLSPDGNYLACVDSEARLKVVDTKTGQKAWEKKNFYTLNLLEYYLWLIRPDGYDDHDRSLFRIQFTPDSRYVIFSRSNKYRFGFPFFGPVSSEKPAVGLELSTLKTVDLGGELKDVVERSYAFIDSGRLVGASEAKPESAGVFSFPGGKRLKKLEFLAERVKATANSNYVIMRVAVSGETGVFDIERNALVGAIDRKDITAWENTFFFESDGGTIIECDAKYQEETKVLDGKDKPLVELPSSAITSLQVAETSDDFSWLLLSSETRGGVWDLRTGEQKILTRGFKGGVIDSRGIGVADFPVYKSEKHRLALLNGAARTIGTYRELPDLGAIQRRRFLLTRTSIRNKSSDRDPFFGFQATPEDRFEVETRSDVRLEIKDWIQDKVIWSHDFKGVAPRTSFDDYSGRLLIYWWLGGDEGRARLKQDPELSKRADSLGDKTNDYLIEVVDGSMEKPAGLLLLETGKGSFEVTRGQSQSDWLAFNDSEGRILVYSLADGTLRHRFFGFSATFSAKRDLIAVGNLPGEVTIYRLTDGGKIGQYQINGNVAFARFNMQGDRLLLLSDRQIAYAIDLTRP